MSMRSASFGDSTRDGTIDVLVSRAPVFGGPHGTPIHVGGCDRSFADTIDLEDRGALISQTVLRDHDFDGALDAQGITARQGESRLIALAGDGQSRLSLPFRGDVVTNSISGVAGLAHDATLDLYALSLSEQCAEAIRVFEGNETFWFQECPDLIDRKIINDDISYSANSKQNIGGRSIIVVALSSGGSTTRLKTALDGFVAGQSVRPAGYRASSQIDLDDDGDTDLSLARVGGVIVSPVGNWLEHFV